MTITATTVTRVERGAGSVHVLGMHQYHRHLAATSQASSLRHAIVYHRRRTWAYQDRVGVTRTPTEHAERRSDSIPFLGWVNRLWQRRLAHARRLATSHSGSVPTLICSVFGSACSKAVAVARCESGFSIHTVNGIYLGIFQMGTTERATYGMHDARGHMLYRTAYQQIVAAHNYYMVSGWAPWACA